MEGSKLKKLLWIVGIAVAIIVGVSVIGVERIDVGHVGLRENLTGGDKGVSTVEYCSGWQWYTEGLTRIHEIPIAQQHPEYAPFNVQAKGGTIFTVHPSFNYSVVPGEAANMFKKLRQPLPLLEKGYIFNSLRIALRETTNTFSPDSMLNNVSAYDAAVTDKLNHQLSPYFIVTQFTSGLEPDERLRAAIAEKAQTIQEAITLENKQRKIRIEAENELLIASKDSAIKVKGALAEARSIREVNEALRNSPQFVEKIKAERWDGKLPQYMLGGNSGMFLNLKPD